jgi:hypothetical protein
VNRDKRETETERKKDEGKEEEGKEGRKNDFYWLHNIRIFSSLSNKYQLPNQLHSLLS